MKYCILAISILFSQAILQAQQAIKKEKTPLSQKQPLAVADFDATIAYEWNNLYLEVERHAVRYYRPPQSARILAYIGIATYESLVGGMPHYNHLNFKGLKIPAIDKTKKYHWAAVYNAVYANMLKYFFPLEPIQIVDANAIEMINTMQQKHHNIFLQQTTPEILALSEEYGTTIANIIFEWSATDTIGHNSFHNPIDYTYHFSLPKQKGIYYDHSLSPYWGKCRLFVANQSDIDNSNPPLTYSEDKHSTFYKQALEVKLLVDSIKQGKAYDEKWKALFWSDDIAGITFTPAARLISILNQVVVQQDLRLDKAVESYAKLGIGLSDAAVVCWALKYRWHVERPVTYIRREIDPSWGTIMGSDIFGDRFGDTPMFPAYPSGHSIFGGVGGEILTTLFGDNYEMIDNSHKDRDDIMAMPRYFKSFYQMAEENAYSRIAIGVHFRMDCDEGLRLGYLIGKRVNGLKWHKENN